MYEFSKDDLQYPVLSIVEMCLPSARMESLVTAEEKKICKYIKYLIYSLILLNADNF